MYTVVYRKGGTHNATWHRTVEFTRLADAHESVDELNRAGYKTHVQETRILDAIGLPVGWCAHCDPITGECVGNCTCE